MKKLSLTILLFFFVNVIIGQIIPEKPANYQSVVDKASILSAEEQKSLSSKLDAFEKETGNEVVIVTVESLKGSTIEKFANKLFTDWGLGKKGKDNGVLILVSLKDRKMRIETGYGVEEFLTDSECSNIIDELMKPEFRNGKYYEGLELATNYIVKELNSNFATDSYALRKTRNVSGLNLTQTKSQRRKDSLNPWFIFFFGLLIQFGAGFVLVKKSNFVRKRKGLKDNLEMSLFMVTLFFGIGCLIIALIADEEKLYFSSTNKLILIATGIAVIIYYIQLLPKKVGKITGFILGEFFRLFVSALVSMLLGLFVMIFTDSDTVYLVTFFLLTALIYYLSYTGKLDWLDSGGSSSYSSSYRSSSSSYSDYSRSSYSDSYSDSSYGGGSSGGGGASGSW